MRGTATREPYSPWESRPGDTEPSRSVEVSWSESKDSATQTRAPSFQRAGWSERPARTFSTPARHRLGPGPGGIAVGLVWAHGPMDSPAERRRQVEVGPAPMVPPESRKCTDGPAGVNLDERQHFTRFRT